MKTLYLIVIAMMLATTAFALADDSSQCTAAVDVADWPNVVIYCKADAEAEAAAAQEAGGDLQAMRFATAGERMVTVAAAYYKLDMMDDYGQAYQSAGELFRDAFQSVRSRSIRATINDGYVLFTQLPQP